MLGNPFQFQKEMADFCQVNFEMTLNLFQPSNDVYANIIALIFGEQWPYEWEWFALIFNRITLKAAIGFVQEITTKALWKFPRNLNGMTTIKVIKSLKMNLLFCYLVIHS